MNWRLIDWGEWSSLSVEDIFYSNGKILSYSCSWRSFKIYCWGLILPYLIIMSLGLWEDIYIYKLMSETAYIDELLKAEQAANEIISNAQRERFWSQSHRQRKLKEAKEAAEQEVNKYRQQKEAEFDALRERVLLLLWEKEDKEFEAALEKETATEISQI